MLTQLLTYLHNFFPEEAWYGSYTIEDGALCADFIEDGQYFRIQGSRFNDGVYQFHAGGAGEEGLKDETFTGTVTSLRIPTEILALAGDIKAWQEKYGALAASPYLSEKFGDYSYSKGSTFGSVTVATTWQAAFASRLTPWKKL